MPTTTVFGIRHTADLTGEFSDFVIDSVNLLNEQLADESRCFLFDTVDVRQQVIGGSKVWDMYGWVVDKADLDKVEPAWLADEDERIDEFAPEAYECATWVDEGGKPVATFD